MKELAENNQDRVIGTFPLFQLQTQALQTVFMCSTRKPTSHHNPQLHGHQQRLAQFWKENYHIQQHLYLRKILSLRVQIIQLQWKQHCLHQSLHFLSLSLHHLLEHQKNLQLNKSVPVINIFLLCSTHNLGELIRQSNVIIQREKWHSKWKKYAATS